MLNRDQAEALEGGVELAEGVATLTGLRGQTRTEDRRLTTCSSRRPTPARLGPVHDPPGLEAPAAADVRGVGAPVRRLVRVRIGTLRLDEIAAGDVRVLTTAEVRRLVLATSDRLIAGRLRPLSSAACPAAPHSPRDGSSSPSMGRRRAARARSAPPRPNSSQLRFVDTGLFYRALTALALLRGSSSTIPAVLVPLVDRVSLGDDGSGRFTRVLLDGSDATEEARSALVDGSVSTVARVPEVRAALLERQRELAADGGIVMAGRDVGTVVLPDADLKLFLDASVEERARRRIDERGLDPDGAEAEEVREQLRARDAIDTGREVAPLRAADDAVHVLTDGNVFDETVEIVAAEIAGVMLTPRPRTRTRKAPVARLRSRGGSRGWPSAPTMAEVPAAEAEPAPKPKRTRAPKAAAAARRVAAPKPKRTR